MSTPAPAGAGESADPVAEPPIDLAAVRRFALLAVERLSEAREEIDALNVFPVPDGDTGTNLYLTVEAARDALAEAMSEHPDDLQAALWAYSRGALLGARGNSGVILSQLVGALLRRLALTQPGERSALAFAEGLRLAADAAYAAVGEPVEGTMLTVAREAAEAAEAAADDGGARLGAVLAAATEAAAQSVERTPELLPLLRDAGVVDAGGRGLCVILEAVEAAVTGKHPRAVPRGPAVPRVKLPTGDLTEDGPAYEVMYLLEAEESAIPRLRESLALLGDSLVVVGGEGLWNVHVHVDDVGAAVEVGIEAGRPRRIRVTHFAEQLTRRRESFPERRGRALVAVAAGAGLAALFEAAGATVLTGGPGQRPSTGEILQAVRASAGEEVIVLPNDPDSVGVAQAAASAAAEEGITVVVIPTRAQVQGIAALAVHEPGLPINNDVIAMTAAAGDARHGAITHAARAAMTTAGPCEPGDVLGVINGDFAIVGSDDETVAVEVLSRLLAGAGGDLVTLVGGQGAGDLVERCAQWVRSAHPGVDVLTYDGGQERYPLLLAVE